MSLHSNYWRECYILVDKTGKMLYLTGRNFDVDSKRTRQDKLNDAFEIPVSRIVLETLSVEVYENLFKSDFYTKSIL